ncbi:MAG TPA: GIY-YIG nuclease family protein [Nostoc sp.]|uniref:GIY-YIG nuclease family protein n=1 Tax=Nostoc sp. TaxID=1180 RepID=UPI002D6C8212|nr:GIY-YIG nuclease family protein [Nostoc sp.]HYX16792.1 GIY-YIG nuclease family protein [Nostoc sp.]
MVYNFDYFNQSANQPGYVYLLIAQGYHGIIPGLLLKRCKIGLSRNPEARVKQIASFEGSQPPCDIAILETVYVQDMKKVEGKLHKKFKASSVKLKKSREWFDLWIWQIWLAYFWMKVYQVKN